MPNISEADFRIIEFLAVGSRTYEEIVKNIGYAGNSLSRLNFIGLLSFSKKKGRPKTWTITNDGARFLSTYGGLYGVEVKIGDKYRIFKGGGFTGDFLTTEVVSVRGGIRLAHDRLAKWEKQARGDLSSKDIRAYRVDEVAILWDLRRSTHGAARRILREEADRLSSLADQFRKLADDGSLEQCLMTVSFSIPTECRR